jgi:phosphate uptake regulator
MSAAPASLKRRVERKIDEMAFEVIKQVRDCRDFFLSPAEALARKIIARDDYVDVLKSEIADLTAVVRETEVPGPGARVWFQAASIVGNNLERIGDCTVGSAEYALVLRDPKELRRYQLERFLRPVLPSLDRVRSCLVRPNLRGAYRICRTERETVELYCDAYGQALRELREGFPPEEVIPILLISQYLQRMGEGLLNIGEAALSTLLGEKLKIHQYRGLSGALRAAGMELSLSALDFEPIFGTRSGSRVAALGRKAQREAPRRVIFKTGTTRKMAGEVEGIARWEEIAPGAPPRVLGFDRGKAEVFLVLDRLEGRTLEDLALHAAWDEIEEALVAFEHLLEEVWSRTRGSGPVPGSFAEQLGSRIGDVLKVYPRLVKLLNGRGGVRSLVADASSLGPSSPLLSRS